MIRFIEELSFNAWPSLHTVYYDGWLVRFANSYSRRTNSVNPLYASTLPIAEKIARCEALYRDRGQRAVFKLTQATQPGDLDALLEARGYAFEAPTSVQTLTLSGAARRIAADVTIAAALTDGWFTAFCRLNRIAEAHHATIRAMLEHIVPACGFAALRIDGETGAVGLGVADAGYVGLFDLVTDERLRGQGLGTRLIESLLRWGQDQRAGTAYLQVMESNAPALALYARMGFRAAYRYWYRTKGV